jgi:protein-S-isoprenylcysteine O-methyltransferase Ste14
MRRVVPILVLLLAAPALADGAMDMFLIVITGGPLAALATSAWGLHRTRDVAPGWPCCLAALLSVVGAILGYWLGICIGDYRLSHATYGGAVAFWGPLAVFFSALFARLPSLILGGHYPADREEKRAETDS